MAETYEVFGQMKMGPCQAPPQELEGKTARIKCADGEVLEVPAEALALSFRAKKDLLEKGCDQDFEVPLGKGVVVKLMEYLKHHTTNEYSEIRTPLASDHLVDCGASRWDASFANVDKEMLFDLTVAASYLDIPGLWFLLSAKAALMTTNKSADKLRKEFMLTNDFPATEENDLRRKSAADMSRLAASSVIRNGVKAAEYKAGIKQIEDGTSAPSAVVNTSSWRQAMWRAAVLDDWKLLEHAPEPVKNDRDLVKSAILTSQGAALKLASPEMRADEALVLEATKYFGTAFADAAPELRNNKDFLLKAVGVHGGAMTGAPDALRRDKSFMLEAAKVGKGNALQGATVDLRDDRNLILEMAVHDAEAYKHASEDLLNDKDFAVAVAKRNGKALKFMIPAFRADPDVVRAAITRDPQAAQYAHASRRAELGMIQDSMHGEVQLQAELESQKKAAQEEAASTLALATTAGPRQVPMQALPSRPTYTCMKLQKTVQFTAMSTMTANMGQSNYIAANSYLDKIPGMQRPEVDAVGLMWGAVGGIGMRFKAFASEDILNATPELLLTIPDSCKVLCAACCTINPPEWFSASHFDKFSREMYLSPSAGQIKLEEQTTEVAAQAHWEKHLEDDRKALQDLASVDRRPVPDNFALVKAPAQPALANAPLGGWPSLVSSPPSSGGSVPLQKGTRVRLTGLRAKNGVCGTLAQQYGDGKWKVKLDDGSGNALLRPGFFEPFLA
mmetsp:Transcript_67460/g.160938  ORF Transcript_67460/g.160938 Transcript_67460/m.160938 type:complete len:731 (+) Transcript_67460:80-2272(+)